MNLSFCATALVAIGTTAALAQPIQSVGETVTITGCLQRAERNGSLGGTIVGTSASPSTAAEEANSGAMVDAFLLTEATVLVAGVPAPPAGALDGSTTAPPSTTGTTGQRAEITSYGLAGQEAELERHQGARLQVTGTIVPPATSNRGTGGTATAAGAKRIKVNTFKVLAETCSGTR